jgi:DNA-directed RNA polymerase delta subunit
MEQEEFMHLADNKRELDQFLKTVVDEDFDAIGARKCVLAYQHFSYITDQKLVKEIVEFLQVKLEEINKKIEEL